MQWQLSDQIQRDQLDELLWEKSCEHRHILECQTSVDDLIRSLDPVLDPVYKSNLWLCLPRGFRKWCFPDLMRIELELVDDVKAWVESYNLASQTTPQNSDLEPINYHCSLEQYLKEKQNKAKIGLQNFCIKVQDLKKNIVQVEIEKISCLHRFLLVCTYFRGEWLLTTSGYGRFVSVMFNLANALVPSLL